MKKTSLGLIVSVMALIVAVMVTSVSTYAWFAQNTNVKAETMKVTAKTANAYLQIGDGEGTTFGTQIIFDDAPGTNPVAGAVYAGAATADELNLVTVSAITPAGVISWGEGESNDPTDANASSELEDVTAENLDDYVLSYTLTLKNTSATVDANKLEAHVTVTGGDSAELDNALRVLLVTENGNYALFNKAGTCVNNLGYQTGESVAYVLAGSNQLLAETLDAEATLKVTIYVYFDGTDTNAKTESSISVQDLGVSVKFTTGGDTASHYNVDGTNKA